MDIHKLITTLSNVFIIKRNMQHKELFKKVGIACSKLDDQETNSNLKIMFNKCNTPIRQNCENILIIYNKGRYAFDLLIEHTKDDMAGIYWKMHKQISPNVCKWPNAPQ